MTAPRRGDLQGGAGGVARAGLLAALAVACRTPEAAAGDARGVEACLRGIVAADNAGDLDAIAASYAEDAVLLPPGAPPVLGRAAIASRYAEGLARFRLRLELDEDERRVSGDLAWSRGRTVGAYVWRDGSPPTPFRDTYLMTLARGADGRWRIACLMWSHLEPEAPPLSGSGPGDDGDGGPRAPRSNG